MGNALDPEWRLGPGQGPKQQIGGVDVAEVNPVIAWLAQPTALSRYPQSVAAGW